MRLPVGGAIGPDVTRVAAELPVRDDQQESDIAWAMGQNWKMATEGGGRHSPSTVVWEEEGVLGIVQAAPFDSIEPKVMDSSRMAPFAGQMNVWPPSRARRKGGA